MLSFAVRSKIGAFTAKRSAKTFRERAMGVGGPSFEVPRSESPPERRLDSWKEIAAYLNRDVTTVQRWEKREGMPVYRHVHDKRGSVYALPEELNAWREQRRSVVDEQPEVMEPGDIADSQPSVKSTDGWGIAPLWWVV